MATNLRRMGSAWTRFTEPLLLNRKGHAATAHALRAARIGMFPEWYLSLSYFASAVSGLALAAITFTLLGFADVIANALVVRVGLALAVGVMWFFLTRLFFLMYPRLRAQGRARRIDLDLPAIVTLCYALAKGGTTPLEIFRGVSSERQAYGEAAVEFGVIVRNVDLLGQDLVAALKDTSSTTPSANLKAFLDGLVTILNSGADPRDYFKHQAAQQLTAAELGLERDLEQASMLAEVYVSGLLVLPLLLLVVLAGLAPLAPGQDALMPFVVFALIPLGTVVYLILLETLLPPDVLTTPKTDPLPLNDFGLDTVPKGSHVLPPPWKLDPEIGQAERRLHRRLAWERFTSKIADGWGSFVRRMMAKPTDAIQFSGFVGLAVAGGVGWWLWSSGTRGGDLVYAITGVLVAAGIVTVVPISIFHEMRVRRARKVEEALPDALNKLAGFNERGIGILQSFQLLGRSATGPLAVELRAVERDVGWSGTLAGALHRLRERIGTMRMTKLGILLERSSAATGDLREVLEIAANDATKTEHLRATKRQSMMSYVIVCYIVFAVFLYVLYVVANLFYGPQGLGAAASNAGGSLSLGMSPDEAKLLFAQAGVIQGVGCGLVAGRLGEGHLLSGIKHAVLLGVIAYLVFLLGVL